MSFRSSASGESGRLAIGGSLTIENAARIREKLVMAFSESDRVILEIGADAVADVSFMQILCSAQQTAFIEKKKFEVDWSAAPKTRLSMASAGYNFAEQCFSDAGKCRTLISGDQDE